VDEMGDIDIVENPDSHNSGENRKATKVAVIMLLLGLFSPFLIIFQSYGYSWYLSIQSMLWMYTASGSMYPGQGFMLIPPYAWISMFPFVLLRLVPVSQIYRYYQGKTTRRRTVIALFFGDGFFLFYGLIAVLMITFGMFLIVIPVIAQIIFGAFMLWKYPYREPRTEWDSVLEEKQWWEKDEIPRKTKEKPKDENELW